MWSQIAALVAKELQQLFASPRNRMVLVMPLVLQLSIFPFAATMEVRNATLAVFNEDQGAPAIELLQRLAAASAFNRVMMLHSDAEMRRVIDGQEALLAIRIPPDFSRRVQLGEPVRMQALIDGRRSNAAQIAFSYAEQVTSMFAAERGAIRQPVQLVVRNLYNPNLEYQWFVLPSLVAIIATVGCLMVTALSLAREKEEGTFDQLMVTPLTPAHIMLGKAIPGILVSMAQGGIIAAAAVLVYGVPLTGPAWLLGVATFAYALSLSGVGLMISAICTSQQQAFMGVFCFMVPSVVLSGYLAPVENMPAVLQAVAQVNPLTHFIAMSKGIFLRGQGWADSRGALAALLAIAAVTLSLAYAVFWRQTRT